MNSTLKQKIRSNEVTIGSWITLADPSVAEIMANSGFDWLTVDMEHSGLSDNQALELIRTVTLCRLPCLVRVAENHPDFIKKYMDMGATGVIVPHVNSKQEALKAVNAVKYPPQGTRGVGLSRAQNYSLELDAYREWNQESSIVIVQVEHFEAVQNLEDIMSVEGVDGFFVGPYDLSGSLGCPGDFQNPKMISALEVLKKKSIAEGFLMGLHVVQPDPKLVSEKVKEGFKFIAFGTDFLFLGENCRNSMRKLKKSLR